MAIDPGTKSIVVCSKERPYRINIETTMGVDPVVTAFREVVKFTPDSAVISKGSFGYAQPNLSSIADRTITVPGIEVTLTMAQLAAIVAATADEWRKAGIAAASKVGQS